MNDTPLSSGSPILQVESASKYYARREILHDITLSVARDEIFGLVGLNGAGKTTLIKLVLDLIRLDGGRIIINGQSHDHHQARAGLFYLPEKFQPALTLKAHEFLRYTLAYYGVRYDAAVAAEQATRLGLAPEALRWRIGAYSKGMTQKLGLLAALLANRPLLLLDEPMSGLDPEARIQLKALLLDYQRMGRAVFFTSHILADIEEICHRIAVLHQGRLLYSGAPDAFIAAYRKEAEGRNSLHPLTLETAFLRAIEA